MVNDIKKQFSPLNSSSNLIKVLMSRLTSYHLTFLTIIITTCCFALSSFGQSADAALDSIGDDNTSAIVEYNNTNSLMARTIRAYRPDPTRGNSHALRDLSMFTVPPPRPREFAVHDLVEIIVRESSTARSRQSLDTQKEYGSNGAITKFPSFDLRDLLQLQIQQGSGTNVPELDITFDKEFKGDGEYERRDDLTARLTAEVIEILPNGNLIIEAQRSIRTDEEASMISVTGICRAEDVTATNTILSNQLHDLTISLHNTGELKESSQKGIIAKVLDAIFAF